MKRFLFLLLVLIGVSVLIGCNFKDVTEWTSHAFFATFALIGIWYIFWPVLVISFFILAYMTEEMEGKPLLMFLSLVIFLSIIEFAGKANFLTFIKESTLLFLLYGAAYLIAGIIWVYFRLYTEGRRARKKFQAEKAKFLKEHDNNEKDWLTYLSGYGATHDYEFMNKKGLILSWLFYWPCSVLWYFCHDALKELGEFIYTKLRNSFRAIYEKALGDVLAELKEAKETGRPR